MRYAPTRPAQVGRAFKDTNKYLEYIFSTLFLIIIYVFDNIRGLTLPPPQRGGFCAFDAARAHSILTSFSLG